MDTLISPEYIGQIITAIVLAGAGILIGMFKLYKSWKEIKVETSILTMMHQELERLSVQNKILGSELNKFQLEIIKLSKELYNLNVENDRLKGEIQLLTSEITKLQRSLNTDRGQTWQAL